MLNFSQDATLADQQMRAVIFYLTTFGYIDGDFDDSEKDFVRNYIQKLIAHRISSADSLAEPEALELQEKYSTHFLEVFEGVDRQVLELYSEVVADGENQAQFVEAKLKLHCFEIFKSFDEANQEALMSTIDELIHADGQVHPAEAKFRGELADLLNAELGVELIDDELLSQVAVRHPDRLDVGSEDHPFFWQFEQHYSADKEAFTAQVQSDRQLMDDVMRLLDDARARGAGKLKGKSSFEEFEAGADFLDGHIQVKMPEPRKEYELIVVGDLHGCYSCLKAVLHQTKFFAKVEAFQADPVNQVCPRLVLLGDYIDRGMFSYQGVLRSVLQLFAKYPEFVVLLRGNHEYYVEHNGRVYGAVRPSEAMDALRPHFSEDVFQHYVKLFDALPTSFYFEKFLFVHGGIPRDATIKAKFKDLSDLNHWDLRFQMMWSDPSSADVIPSSLQEQSARFPFGKLQCQSFLQRVGCHTIFRGHEKVEEGFRQVYDEEQTRLFTVFSSGGVNNHDLPPQSSYRSVTPMAARLHFRDGSSQISPFAIDYESFNEPARNRFYQSEPEISSSI